MCKKNWLLSLLLAPVFGTAQISFGSSKLTLQNPETVTGSVLYDFAYVSDTTKPDVVQKEVVRVDFSEKFSNFFSQTYRVTDSISTADLERQLKEQDGQANLNLMAKERQGTAEVFLYSGEKSAVYELKKFMNKSYLLAAAKPVIDWDIQDSTKTIGGYTCQKAVGTIQGRQYVAWFTTDLPYSFGPRRLNGLPGLIVEAYDITHRIVYTFKQYIAGSSGRQVGLPADAITSSPKEYKEMMDAFRANPQGFMSGSSSATPAAPGGGNAGASNIKSMSITVGSPMGKVAKKVNNFPIDLTAE